MQTQWRDLAVILDGSPQGERIGRHAAALARRHRAHLVGLYGVGRTAVPTPAETFARGSASMGAVVERQRSADEARIVAAGRAFSTLAHAYQVSSEFRIVWRDLEHDDAALRTLHADLVVAAQSTPKDLPRDWGAEHLLFVGSAPVLLVPDDWSREDIGDAVIIGWNGSREVRRAVNDAMPFLRQAKAVTVLILQAQATNAADETGADVVRHLERHDLAAKLVSADSSVVGVADSLQRSALELGASLLVIGGYSRPRTSERLFGGVTLSLLRNPRLPIFISR